MKEKFVKGLKKYWLVIWIVAAVAALSTIGVLAAYTSISSVKRVVSTQKGVGNLFSSNYLTETNNGSAPLRNVTFSSEDADPIVTVSICNFPQTRVKYNDKDITYTLTVTLVDSNGKEIDDAEFDKYSVTFGGETTKFSSDGKSITYQDKVLSTGGFSYDDFILNFDKSQLTSSNVFMKLVAEPTDPSDLPTLSAIIGVSYVKPYSASWMGQFTDNTANPSDLDGFNYRLSGSGAGTITLSWDTKYIEISKWFLEENSSILTYDKSSLSVASIELKVDSSKQNQYDIQFYRKQAPDQSESWSGKNNVVLNGDKFITKFEFSADAETTE